MTEDGRRLTFSPSWGGIWWDESTGETVFEFCDPGNWPLDVDTSERAKGVML